MLRPRPAPKPQPKPTPKPKPPDDRRLFIIACIVGAPCAFIGGVLIGIGTTCLNRIWDYIF